MSDEIKDWLSVDEAAEKMKIGRNTVLRAIYKKELRAIRMGRGWRITEEDLGKWVAKRANMGRAA